jgi:tripartite ATP-independent transporter DctP family solute receptor
MRKIASAAALLAAFAAGPALGQGLELKFGHVGEPGSLFEASANEFARVVNDKLAGKAKVVTFGSSQLGGDKEMLQKLKLGTLEFTVVSTVMSSEVDLYGLFELPYLVKDRAHMGRIEKEIVWPVLVPAAEQKGYTVLAVWENGFRHITNSKRPIMLPADLKGIKLRVPEGKWRVKMFQAYGANPSPMKFSEVFVALQTGVMDGQENPFAQIYSAKFHEVQKYLSLTGHVYTPAFVLTGTRKWASQPAELRTAIEQIARDTQAFVYATAERFDRDAVNQMKPSGIQVNEVDKGAFIEASKPIYEEFGREINGALPLIEKAVALGKSS